MQAWNTELLSTLIMFVIRNYQSYFELVKLTIRFVKHFDYVCNK